MTTWWRSFPCRDIYSDAETYGTGVAIVTVCQLITDLYRCWTKNFVEQSSVGKSKKVAQSGGAENWHIKNEMMILLNVVHTASVYDSTRLMGTVRGRMKEEIDPWKWESNSTETMAMSQRGFSRRLLCTRVQNTVQNSSSPCTYIITVESCCGRV